MKIIIMLLLTSTLILAQDNYSDNVNLKVKEIIEKLKSNKTEAIVEGVVIDVKTLKENILLGENATSKSINIISKIKFKVLKSYKKGVKKEIYVYIPGGLYLKDGKMRYHYVSEGAHPLLELGDHILMGLRKYRDGYTHVFGQLLQIPYDNQIIEDIQRQKTEQKLRKLYSKNMNYSNEEEEKILNQNKKITNEKKIIIKVLKKSLDELFKKREVYNE